MVSVNTRDENWSVLPGLWRPVPDGGEADDAAAADGRRPAVAAAGGEPHGQLKLSILPDVQ